MRDFKFLSNWSFFCSDIEWLCVELHFRATRPTYIGVLYRLASGNVEQSLNIFENKVMDILCEGPADILVLGDINIDCYKPHSTNCRRYRSMCNTLGLVVDGVLPVLLWKLRH